MIQNNEAQAKGSLTIPGPHIAGQNEGEKKVADQESLSGMRRWRRCGWGEPSFCMARRLISNIVPLSNPCRSDDGRRFGYCPEADCRREEYQEDSGAIYDVWCVMSAHV